MAGRKRAPAVDPAPPLTVHGVPIPAGRRTDLELNVTRLATGTWASIPVAIVRGTEPGPRVWITGAIHGDELNGVEIARQLVPRLKPRALRGTVIAVPIVNVLGFLHRDRYLPDRRDLNRSFPGSARGSLAAQMAHLLLSEIVDGSDFGIDLHTGSNMRYNHPQIRADLSDERLLPLIRAFQPPLAIHAKTRDGSLRAVATSRGCPVLLYEAGEAQRFDRSSIRLGVRGILRVLRALGMIDAAPDAENHRTRYLSESRWVRAPRGGIVIAEVSPGDTVEAGEVLARVSNTFSTKERPVRAPFSGVVVGLGTNPLVNRGDAIAHVGVVGDVAPVGD